MFLQSNKQKYRQLRDKTVEHLKKKNKILFLTTSNRWQGGKDKEISKSSQLAQKIAELVGKNKVQILDIPALKIYPCEANVSSSRGNVCGEKQALLQDSEKNPSGYHRCWASINNPDDELWQVSKALFASDCVIFFGSVRWGQTNVFYQKLIERMTWIENRHSSLGEDNIVADIEAGIILIGHNWRGEAVLEIQKEVLQAFGFQVKKELCWAWQYTSDFNDETLSGYQKDIIKFKEIFYA